MRNLFQQAVSVPTNRLPSCVRRAKRRCQLREAPQPARAIPGSFTFSKGGTIGWFCLVVLAAAVWHSAAASAQAGAAKRPNVVLVMTDDQGYGDLACHGNPEIRTPTLDRLYEQSVRLTNFHVDPTCSPTRSALLTGRYSCRTGVWHTIMGRSLLRRDEVTMANLFAAAGYRTAVFGKWHLGDNYPYRAVDRGWHESLVHGGGGIGQTPDYWGNTYFSPVLLHNGNLVQTQGYCTNVFFDAAIRFIEANRTRPFLVYLPTNVAHAPYQVAEKYAKPYEQAGLPRQLALFYGMIENFDENMARLLHTLDRLDLANDTILIYMTDNGTSGRGFNANMRGRKGSVYEGGHRVPCFIRWPGTLTGGRSIDRLTAHIDLLPTLLDLCGIDKPAQVKFDGTSLRPLLFGEETAAWPDRTLFVQSHRIEHPQPWRNSAVMTQRYRLVDGKELYDVVDDPSQKRDIAAEHPEVVARLRKAYETWYADVSQRFGEYCPIVIGAREANPVLLTCHDWHGEQVPWNQSHVRRNLVANGFWAIEVARPGRYRFVLRERPAWVNAPLEAEQARIKIGQVDRAQQVPAGSSGAEFVVDLPAGQTRLQTWLTDGQGVSRGAYFVDIRYLGPAGQP